MGRGGLGKNGGAKGVRTGGGKFRVLPTSGAKTKELSAYGRGSDVRSGCFFSD